MKTWLVHALISGFPQKLIVVYHIIMILTIMLIVYVKLKGNMAYKLQSKSDCIHQILSYKTFILKMVLYLNFLKKEIHRVNQQIILNKQLTQLLSDSVIRHPAYRQRDIAQIIELKLYLVELEQELRLLSLHIF